MARPHTGGGARREIEVITKINHDDELITFLNQEKAAVSVVDMYPHFCGPCEPMTGVFKRLKLDYQDQVMFAQAQTDHISFFEAIRDRSCPMFSIWVCGVFVNLIRGANSSLLEKVIKEQVEANKISTDRNSTIPEIDIPQIIRQGTEFHPGTHHIRLSTTALADGNEETQFTVCIIKPDCIQPHIVNEVTQLAKMNRFEIVKERRLWLTQEMASSLYAEHTEQSFFNELIEYITFGPIIAMLLSYADTGSGSEQHTKDHAIQLWRNLVGPASPKHALEIAPKSLRAQFGKDGLHNGFYASECIESAQRIMELIFAPPATSSEPPPLLTNIPINTDITMTVCILSPDVTENADHVQLVIHHALFIGFEVYKRLTCTLTKEQVVEWLGDLVSESDLQYWTSKPVTCIALKGEDVLILWNEHVYGDSPLALSTLIGSSGSSSSSSSHNAIRCSDSADHAHRQLNIFFPRPMSSMLGTLRIQLERTMALIKPDATAAGNADQIIARILELGFRIVDKKLFTMTMDLASEFYAEHREKPFFADLTLWMTSAPIWALVLEREHAVSLWREAMGPTNAIKAKEEVPDSIRAKYGTNGSQNAVHGSDSKSSAKREITLVFSEIHASPSRIGSRAPSRVPSTFNIHGGSQSNPTVTHHSQLQISDTLEQDGSSPDAVLKITTRPTSSSSSPKQKSRPNSSVPDTTTKPTRPTSSSAPDAKKVNSRPTSSGTADAKKSTSRPSSSTPVTTTKSRPSTGAKPQTSSRPPSSSTPTGSTGPKPPTSSRPPSSSTPTGSKPPTSSRPPSSSTPTGSKPPTSSRPPSSSTPTGSTGPKPPTSSRPPSTGSTGPRPPTSKSRPSSSSTPTTTTTKPSRSRPASSTSTSTPAAAAAIPPLDTKPSRSSSLRKSIAQVNNK